MTLRIRACLVSVICLIGLGAGLSTHQAGAAGGQSYVVQANDTLSAIAIREHTSQAELVRLNGISDPNRLWVGQTLLISENGNTEQGTASQGGSTVSTLAVTGQARSYGRHGSADPYSIRNAGNRGSATTPTGAYPTQTAGYVANPTTTYSLQTPSYVGSATGITYVVQPGDSLGALSNRFGISIATLAAINGIDRPELLLAGQRLEIPAKAGTSDSAVGTTAGYLAPLASPTAVSTMFVTASEHNTGPSVPSATATPTTIVVGAGGGAPNGAVTDLSQASVESMLTAEAAAYGVDPALVKAVAWQESGWRMVTAPDGGIGVMQLMPATATWVGPALLGRAIDPNNVQDNIQAGVALLASYLHTYGGNVNEALAAYNAGPGNIKNGIPSYTQQYVNDVLSLRNGYAQ